MRFKTLLILPFLVASLQAASVDDLSFTLNGNGTEYNVTDCLETASGSLDIPSIYNGLPVTSIGNSAFYGCSGLTNITIPNSVTVIGSQAFYNCRGLTNIFLQDSVTTIHSYAFLFCKNLTTVLIGSGLSYISNDAFVRTQVEVFVSELNPTYQSLNGSLLTKDGTELLYVPKSTVGHYSIPEGVTSIGESAFYYCEEITSISMMENVTSIGDDAFYYCSKLTSVSDLNSIISIDSGAFRYCSSLTEITFGNSINSIGLSAFANCISLRTIKFKGDAPLDIGNEAFSWIHNNAFIHIEPGAAGFSDTFYGINTGYPRRIYVNTNATTSGDGTSWNSAYNNLQDALDFTVSGRRDEVWIAEGTYYPIDINNPDEFDRTATFRIKDQVTLYGGFAGFENDLSQRNWDTYRTILSGEIYEDSVYWSLHVTTIDNKNASWDSSYEDHITFDGISITKGKANGTGTGENSSAAVYGSGYVTAINCNFTDNFGGIAGGSTWIANDCNFTENNGGIEGGTWTVTNCSFTGETFTGSTINATNCTFTGGQVTRVSTITANNCIFTETSNTFDGGNVIVNNCNFTETYRRLATSVTMTANDCTFFGGYTDDLSSHGNIIAYGTLTATNCIFSNNSNHIYGGVAYESTLTAINCTFTGNSALTGTIAYNSTCFIFNNIFFNNTSSSQFYYSTINATYETIPSPFNIFANNLIEGGKSAFVSCTFPLTIPDENVIDTDPVFVDFSDPDGADDTWGTEDDGLRLQSSSPAIGLGDASYHPVDTYDLDGDDDTAESLPVDIAGYKRIQDTTLDLGAYEYGNVLGLSSVFTTTASTATGGSVSPSGALVNTQPSEITFTATASNGYVFGYWSGDVPEELEQENPLTVTVEEDGSITAVFLQDSSDSDGDGLSQYQEVIVYGTDPADADSDDDGFDDGYEVETGYSPLSMSSTPDAISGIETAVKYWFNAANGVNYRIEYSTDFENWYILEDNILGASDEIVRYYDTVGTQKRFYRAKRDD